MHRQALECDVSGADQKRILSQVAVCTYAAMPSNRPAAVMAPLRDGHATAISHLLGTRFSVIPRSVERSVDKPVDCVGLSGHNSQNA